MNLSVTLELQAGGPGSGCRGPNCGRPVVNFTIRKSSVGKGFRVVPSDAQGKEVGWLMIGIYGKGIAYVDGASLDAQYRGKGYGKAMYRRAIDELKKDPGVRYFTSSGTLSEDADRVWQSLSKDYPVIYKDGGYELKLR